MVLERGTLLNNRYRIVDILGQGGMGSVYRAIDENLGVEVAVKDNFFTTEEYARQFKREAIILANLRHPNLPRVTDHFVISGQGQYLVMDFIEGEDLRQRMERVGLIPEEEVITIGAAVCDALAYLGSREPPVIHRDLKPGNVKISPHGEIYLVDFGLAKTMHDIHTTATGARAMTPGYSPPEQYGTARTDQRTDIYSLGATLFAALTNTIPEDALARAMDQVELTPLRKINTRISRRLAGVIEKSLNVRPDDRFQTAEEFKQALLNASSIPKRKENDLAVAPAPEEVKSFPASFPLAAEFGNDSDSGQMVEGLSAGFSEASPNQKSKPNSRAARRNRLLRWLPIIAVALLVVWTGIYFFDSGRFYQSFLKNFPSVAGMITSATETQLPVNPSAVVSPSLTLSFTASPTTQMTPTLRPTLTDTPIPTISLTPLPTIRGGSRLIAFASERSGLPQIYVTDLDVTNDGTRIERQITFLPDGACQPDWSPDGLRLVFISPCKANLNYYPTSSLFFINLDGTGLEPLNKPKGGDFDPDWSPDGTKLTFASTRGPGRPQIFITDLEGQEYQTMTEQYTHETQPSWSPDGKNILYIVSSGEERQIWIMDQYGLGRRKVSQDAVYLNFRPSLSPDGKKMLYTQRLRLNSVPFLKLSPFGSDGFVENRPGQDQDPMPMQEGMISPDGLWIVFEGWTGDTGHDIYIMSITGLARERITTDPAIDFDPAWSPVSQ